MISDCTYDCLQKVFELSSDLVVITTAVGNIEMINTSFLQLLGYQLPEMGGKNILEFIHQNDQDVFIRQFNGLVINRYSEDIRFIHKDGFYLWLSWQTHCNQQGGKQIIIAQDVTQSKAAQQIIAESESLKKLNYELTQFNHMLSHDIKEPLRNIVSFSNLAMKEIQPNTKLSEYFSHIINSGKQLDLLINNLVTYNNINSQQAAAFRDIDLQGIAFRLEAAMDKLIQEKNARFLYPKLPKIYGNERFIFLILKHLLENALLYNESPTPIAELKYQVSPTQHEFFITDNGIGIEPQYHSYVFNMFKRLHSRQQYQGAGIGLSIAKKILEKIGGEIAIVYSIPGEGSSFKVSFPILKPSESSSTTPRRVNYA